MACWSRSVLLWLLAGACGLALLGYCVYFDRKRRNTADFKRRLRESMDVCELYAPFLQKLKLRKLKESEEVQEFFLQEIQLGELWLTKGEQKKSVDHLINAISVCAQPNQLIQVLEQTLPPQVFEMLVRSIPYTIQRFETAVSQQNAGDE
ncbi:TOMM20-like protein 1 [Protobothrops mucrosquamatus]|uniref:TOMM20-like protein 1 n=1 Tax=Protobothrops mucrosquamatus TaxID=103944 RepID=UPI0010FAD695|nr:TOMM20-like protein 1 [Protobothrops mucrosquamatus]